MLLLFVVCIQLPPARPVSLNGTFLNTVPEKQKIGGACIYCHVNVHEKITRFRLAENGCILT